jgi:hypothetical protein
VATAWLFKYILVEDRERYEAQGRKIVRATPWRIEFTGASPPAFKYRWEML